VRRWKAHARYGQQLEELMKISLDLAQCCAAGQCTLVAPEVFGQDEEDGRVFVHQGADLDAHAAAIEEAVVLCPAGAIKAAADG